MSPDQAYYFVANPIRDIKIDIFIYIYYNNPQIHIET